MCHYSVLRLQSTRRILHFTQWLYEPRINEVFRFSVALCEKARTAVCFFLPFLVFVCRQDELVTPHYLDPKHGKIAIEWTKVFSYANFRIILYYSLCECTHSQDRIQKKTREKKRNEIISKIRATATTTSIFDCFFFFILYIFYYFHI